MTLLEEALAWFTDPSHWSGSGGLLVRLVQHLAVTSGVVAVAVVLAVPVGIAIGHAHRGQFAVTASTGAARALPTLGLLTLLGLWLGIGLEAPMLALLVLALPPLLASASSGIASADPVTVDAARSIGLTEWQVIRDVELPAAAPILMGGLRSTVLQVVATATLAAYTADAGLGRFIFAGLKTRDYSQMLAGSLLVVALALVLDGVLALAQRATSGRRAPRTGDQTPDSALVTDS